MEAGIVRYDVASCQIQAVSVKCETHILLDADRCDSELLHRRIFGLRVRLVCFILKRRVDCHLARGDPHPVVRPHGPCLAPLLTLSDAG